MRISILIILLFLFVGCSNNVDAIIEGKITNVNVTLDYKNKQSPQINDIETIQKMVTKINKNPRKDVSNVVWERGPDGTLDFENSDGKTYKFTFFSDQENVDVYWLDENKKLFSIDTNLAIKDILSTP